MKFEFLADASDTPPKRPSNPSVGYPSNGDPVTGKPPTTPGAWFYYMLMVEFTTLIEQNGLEPSAENLHQLADVFADFKARASAAEGFATQAKASADAAAVSASSAATTVSDGKQAITDPQAAAVAAIQTQKNEAVAAVTATQSTATESVTAAQASSVSAVKAQEAASIQAIEADSVLAGYAKATDVAATYLPLTGGTMSLGADAGLKFNGQAQICSYMDGAVCIRNLKDPTMPKIYMGNLGSGGGTLSYTNPGDYFAFSAAVKAPSFQATSDARKKTGLTPVHPDLSGLTAYRYTLKDDGKTHVGLVAQEVEKVIPEAVAEDKEGFLALDYNAVVAALVDEVSRLRKRVEALEAAK